MATYLDKLLIKVQIYHLYVMRSHVVKRLAKISPVYPDILDEIRQFFTTSYLTFTCQLWSYWTKFHDIFTRYTGIIYAVNAHIEIAISRSISECQNDESGEFAISVQQILRYLFRYLVANHDKLR